MKFCGFESVGFDIIFLGFEYVYGIFFYIGFLLLKIICGGDGSYSEFYRFYNVDVFEYIFDSLMMFYGFIFFM